MKKSKVYTRTGDVGTTSLIGGERVDKTNARLEAYGTVDELNSFLGMLVTHNLPTDYKTQLADIQNILFRVGASLACTDEKIYSSMVTEETIKKIESDIDQIDSALPPLKSFIIPGGTPSAALCHVCRTVCRRAERNIVLVSQKEMVNEDILKYINRLSDYLFVLGRRLNFIENKEEKNCTSI